MKEFVNTYVKNNMKYIKNFQKFCDEKWLKL